MGVEMSEHQLDALAWLRQLCNEMRGQAQSTLFAYFKGKRRGDDVTTFIVNFKDTVIRRVFPSQVSSSILIKPIGQLLMGHRPQSLHSAGGGGLHEQNPQSEDVVEQTLQAQFLYYRVLTHVLQRLCPQNADYTGDEGKPPAVAVEILDLLRTPDFHLPLLACALEIVSYANHKDGTLGLMMETVLQAGCGDNMISLWEAIGSFMDCFSSGSTQSLLPHGLESHLMLMRQRCEEERVMSRGSHFYELLHTGGGGQNLPGNFALVSSFLVSYALLATQRTLYLTQLFVQERLSDGGSEGGNPQSAISTDMDGFQIQCVQLVDFITSSHLDLCFDRHLSVIIACSMYAIAKANRAKPSFVGMSQLITRNLPGHRPSIFKEVLLESNISHPEKYAAAAQEAGRVGEIRLFYNIAFMDRVEDFVRTLIGDARAVKLAQMNTSVRESSQAMDTEDVPKPWTQIEHCKFNIDMFQPHTGIAAIESERHTSMKVLKDGLIICSNDRSTIDITRSDQSSDLDVDAKSQPLKQSLADLGSAPGLSKSLFADVKESGSDCRQRDQAV